MTRVKTWTLMRSLAAAGAGLVLAGGCHKDDPAAKQGPPPPVPVSAAVAVTATVPEEVLTFGHVEANQTAAIRSQIGGVLTKAFFTEGQTVRQDAPLLTIDSRPYEAALRVAEANLARDIAQYDNARKEEAREKELLGKGVASQGEYDQAKSAADALAGATAADRAAVERAKLDIGYCQISVPFDGRAGALAVDVGNLVKANDIPLVTINQIRPIKVSFAVPQGNLGEIQKQMRANKLVVRAIISGQEDRPETGELTFIDNTINSSTGTVLLKASFDNPQERLWPGQYVNVVLVLSTQADALVVPSRAIQTGQSGDYVFVIGDDMKVTNRPITVDRKLDGGTVVSAGLKADEKVVTDGQLRLRPGSTVEIKKAIETLGLPGTWSAVTKTAAPSPTGAATPTAPAKAEGSVRQ